MRCLRLHVCVPSFRFKTLLSASCKNKCNKWRHKDGQSMYKAFLNVQLLISLVNKFFFRFSGLWLTQTENVKHHQLYSFRLYQGFLIFMSFGPLTLWHFNFIWGYE